MNAIVPGALYIVATPIGHLQDISHRALEVLRGVSLIAAEDTRTTRVLLDHYGIATPSVSYHSHNEVRRVPQLIERLKEGGSVAVVSDAGTPGISDPASVVVRAALEAGYPVVPIPGPTAFVSALVVSGLRTDRFVFEGFLPVKKGRRTRLSRLATEERTIVLYESPHRISRTVRELLEHCGDRRVVLARELTKKFEEVFRGRLSEAAAHLERKAPRGEFVVILEGVEAGVEPGDTDIS
jgi:16S rRNA (cytidine1402-2'-O)-methyltransferase